MFLKVNNLFLNMSSIEAVRLWPNAKHEDRSEVHITVDNDNPYTFKGEEALAVAYVFNIILPGLGPQILDAPRLWERREEIAQARQEAEEAQRKLAELEQQRERGDSTSSSPSSPSPVIDIKDVLRRFKERQRGPALETSSPLPEPAA